MGQAGSAARGHTHTHWFLCSHPAVGKEKADGSELSFSEVNSVKQFPPPTILAHGVVQVIPTRRDLFFPTVMYEQSNL